MKAFDWLFYVFHRFRYPASLPEEIAGELGVKLSNFLTFEEFVSFLTNPSCQPSRLQRFMDREMAEAVFESAQRKEKFGRSSLFSYYFHEGWLEFNLCFDEQARLRRVYLQHKHIAAEQGVEISLSHFSSESVDYKSEFQRH
jgi:hypothetical protein